MKLTTDDFKMRRNSILVVIFLLITSSLFAEKYALIIGIGNYPKKSEWNKIHTANDVILISSLVETSGFSKNNIYALKDENATKSAILKTLLVIKDKATKGDLVYFHFSGHGQQVQDYDGDERDGLDESIVPYDAPKKYRHGVFNHITDDILDSIFTIIREKLGRNGHLFITIDACHSGTAVRGVSEPCVRGTHSLYVNPEWSPDNIKAGPKKSWFTEKGSSLLAPMVVYTASMAHQLNYEYDGTGSLSWAFYKAFHESDISKTSYRTLFKKVVTYMGTIAPLQTPTLEVYGEEDMLVLNGTQVAIKNYFEVEYVNDSTLLMKGGTLQGLFPGAELSVYPENTYDTNGVRAIATANLKECEILHSFLGLHRLVKAEKVKNAWAYLNKRTYGTLKARVNINLPEKLKSRNQLLQLLKEENNIEIVPVNKNFDIQISQLSKIKGKSNSNIWIITTASDIPLDTIVIPPGRELNSSQKIDVLKTVNKSIKANFLRQLELKEDSSTILYAQVIVKDTPLKKSSADTIYFKQEFYFCFYNPGNVDLFFNLIDIQADNNINVILPRPYVEDPDITKYFVKSKSKLIIDTPYFIAGAPAGKEIFKLVYSSKPIDLRVMGSRRAKEDSLNPLADLLKDTTKTRGIQKGTLENEKIGIHTFCIDFIP